MDVKEDDIKELLEFFSKYTYNAWDPHPLLHTTMQRCLELFGQDYTFSVVKNGSGELSTNYPCCLVVLEGLKAKSGEDSDPIPASVLKEPDVCSSSDDEKTDTVEANGSGEENGIESTKNGIAESLYSMYSEQPKIKELFNKARYARCRTRFPVPVILYNKKHICRSATLSGGPEIYGRTSFDYFFSGGGGAGNVTEKPIESEDPEEIIPPEAINQGDWPIFDRVRNQDIRLLKAFRVKSIIDLMVEKKKVKFGVYVTSSEKVDKKNRYQDFDIISLPYPGCEFFRHYRDNGYNGEQLMFDWNQGYVDANIFVPSEASSDSLGLDWELYRSWDLIHLTQNYLKLLLAYLKNDSGGLLVHCISGWDRTPLFVSLLRLSLWADGAIHQSLDAKQMLYLTLAYDWLLFGHNLEDRLNKGEEIMAFCFYFLKHMITAEYSIDNFKEIKTEKKESYFSESKSGIPNIPEEEETANQGLTNGNAVHSPENPEVQAGASSGSSDEQEKPESLLASPEETHVPINSSDSVDEVLPATNGDCSSHADDVSVTINRLVVSDTNDAVDIEATRVVVQFDGISSATSHMSPSEALKNPATIAPEADAVITVNKMHLRAEHLPETPKDQPLDTLTPAPADTATTFAETNGTSPADSANTCDIPLTGLPSVRPTCATTSNGHHVTETLAESISHSPSSDSKQNGTTNGEAETCPPFESGSLSVRADRLLRVQTYFNELYFPSVSSHARSVPGENGASSGLSIIIDNIATKVGIRAANRSTS